MPEPAGAVETERSRPDEIARRNRVTEAFKGEANAVPIAGWSCWDEPDATAIWVAAEYLECSLRPLADEAE